MDEQMIITGVSDGVATVTMNRPDRHNAFDETLIAALTEVIGTLGSDPAVRAIVLRGAGKSFSAGGDLGWMRRMADYGEAQNLDDARRLEALMRTLDGVAKPTIAAVQGPAYGGGVGLVACCDIAIASDNAKFVLSEVKLGLVPAVISPYVIAAIGARAARRYFLTAETFSALEAHRLGLVHEVVPGHMLDAAVAKVAAALAANGPGAIARCKALITGVTTLPKADLPEFTARAIAEARASAEGREGVGAFLEKRPPRW
ncbi:MAG: enoyl-CoA hydratase/isomerase family protein [Rhodospirillaceae bacterium]|nr:enoyl-CoA hydratase/isomerase family protein [Rhodospirillaceae bacterium]MCA8931602.1 enoyl-CoA hydratase/isomerase family protein [Rhodospirillaceae bacterium]